MLLLVHFAFSWFSSLWDPLAVDTVDIWERICTICRSEHPSKWWKMFDVHSTILELLQHRCTQGESAAETKVAEASCWWCKQSCVWLWFFIEVFQQFRQVPVPYDWYVQYERFLNFLYYTTTLSYAACICSGFGGKFIFASYCWLHLSLA